MSPKKRGRPAAAASSALQRPTKRVRVGETSIIGTQSSAEVTQSGRPKRHAAGDPDYSVKANKSGMTNGSNTPAIISKAGAAIQPNVTRKRKPASQLFGKRRTSVTAKAEGEINAPATEGRGRGRPKKVKPTASTAVPDEAASAPPQNTGRPKKLPGRPRKIAKAKKSTKGATAIPKRKAPVHQSTDQESEVDGLPNGTLDADDEDDEADASKSNCQYWLMKAEPESRLENGVDVKFGIDDLKATAGSEAWDGVRNYGARNSIRAMRLGDLAFFYHSNCKVPGIAGVMRIAEEHSVDETAFDPAHPYYDAKSSRDAPKWDIVRVEFVSKFPQLVELSELRSFAKPGGALETMQMLKQSRLSVSAVKPREWAYIMALAGDVEGVGNDEQSEVEAQVEDEKQEADEVPDVPAMETVEKAEDGVGGEANESTQGHGGNGHGCEHGGGSESGSKANAVTDDAGKDVDKRITKHTVLDPDGDH